MMRLRMLGLALVAVFAVSAIAVSSASAALPEFGRCVPSENEKGEPTGKYKDANCQEPVAKGEKGHYEKLKTIEKGKFTSVSGAGTLETVGGDKVTCTGDSDTGEYKTPKSVADVHVIFTGCELFSFTCQTAGRASGEIATEELKGTLGYINEAGKKVGLSLTPTKSKGAFAEFACDGKVFEIVVKEGKEGKGGNSVIGEITPVNTPALTSKLIFTQVKGHQIPEAFEEGGVEGKKDVLESTLGTITEQAGEETTDTITNEEAIEVFA